MSSQTTYRGGQHDTAPIPVIGRRVRHMAAVPPPEDKPRTGKPSTPIWIAVAFLGVFGVLAGVAAGVLASGVVSHADLLPEVIRAGGFTFVILLGMASLITLTAALCVWALAAAFARRAEETDRQQRRIIGATDRLAGVCNELMQRLDAADDEATRLSIRQDNIEATVRDMATAANIVAAATGGLRSVRSVSGATPMPRKH